MGQAPWSSDYGWRPLIAKDHKEILHINFAVNLYRSGSPDLVVIGSGSRLRGLEFESQHRMLEGYFFISICCKNCFLKRPKINERSLGMVNMEIEIEYRQKQNGLMRFSASICGENVSSYSRIIAARAYSLFITDMISTGRMKASLSSITSE